MRGVAAGANAAQPAGACERGATAAGEPALVDECAQVARDSSEKPRFGVPFVRPRIVPDFLGKHALEPGKVNGPVDWSGRSNIMDGRLFATHEGMGEPCRTPSMASRRS